MPGIKMLEDISKKDCLGVVPYTTLDLEDEDGAVELNKEITNKIDIAVIKLPHISNFTDFDALRCEEDVSVRYITSVNEFKNPDLLIIPGTKNTIGDLEALKVSGLFDKILNYSNEGQILGICGGYQMLGKVIEDPLEVETNMKVTKGLGLLDVKTVFQEKKTTTRVEAFLGKKTLNNEDKIELYGYEIHMGKTTLNEGTKPLFVINKMNGEVAEYYDGAINDNNNIMGTYIHGVFDGKNFREHVINNLRTRKGIKQKKSSVYETLREKELDRLADVVRKSLDISKLYKIMGLEK